MEYYLKLLFGNHRVWFFSFLPLIFPCIPIQAEVWTRWVNTNVIKFMQHNYCWQSVKSFHHFFLFRSRIIDSVQSALLSEFERCPKPCVQFNYVCFTFSATTCSRQWFWRVGVNVKLLGWFIGQFRTKS